MMERIFNDENEPFWRSARQMELGVIAPAALRALHRRPVPSDTGKRIGRPRPSRRCWRLTGGHPYATQELCYFLWEETRAGRAGEARELDERRSRTSCAPSTRTSA